MKPCFKLFSVLMVTISLLFGSSCAAYAESTATSSGAAISIEKKEFVPLQAIVNQVTSGQAITIKALKQVSQDTWSFKNGLLADWQVPVASWQGEAGIWVMPSGKSVLGTLLYLDQGKLRFLIIEKQNSLQYQINFSVMKSQPVLKTIILDNQLLLVNKDHNIDLNYKTSLISSSKLGIKGESGIQVSQLIAKDLKALFTDAKRTKGYSLYCTSGFRTVEKQWLLLNQEVRTLTNRGVKNPLEVARRTINLPQQSEHHTGLAIDIVSTNALTKRAFKVSKEAAWVAKNAPNYGFILRYPVNKKAITGIEFEAWHFRYVGKDFAKLLTKEHLTLEEWIVQGKTGRVYTDAKGKKHWFVVVSSADKMYTQLPTSLGTLKYYDITPEWIGIDITLMP